MTHDESATQPPQIPDAAVEAALRGHRTAGEHPGLDRVADAMNSLRRPGATADQAGHALAMAAYQERFAGRRPAGTGPRRVVLLSSAAGLKLLATAGGSAVALGAVATVLFATSLGPGTTPQTLPVGSGSATTSAGTASGKATSTSQGKGPDAKGPAAFGLCNAWSNHLAHGTAEEKAKESTAFRNLAAAAGGPSKVAQYCATVTHPGQGKGKGTGKPDKTKSAKPDKTTTPGATGKPDKTAKPDRTAKPGTTATSKPEKTGKPGPTTTATATATATATSSATATTAAP